MPVPDKIKKIGVEYMLSIRTAITADDIFAAREISTGHPVYLLEGEGDGKGNVDAIVIKQEMGDRRDVQAVAQIMNLVDKKAQQISLSGQEVQAIRTYAMERDQPDVESFRTCKAIETALRQGGSWIKMPLKVLLTLDKAVEKLAKGNKQDVRIIARSLRQSGGLEKFGEIIAADLFNGNYDRFRYPPSQASKFLSDGSFVGRVVVNQGNIFVACTGGGRGTPVGLDNFDPNSDAGRLSGKDSMGGDTDYSDQNWGGHLLLRSHKNQWENYAAGLIADMEELLGGPRNRKKPFSSKNRLGTARKRRLTHGMESGKKTIKTAFSRWSKQEKLGQNRPYEEGIAKKLAALGWN